MGRESSQPHTFPCTRARKDIRELLFAEGSYSPPEVIQKFHLLPGQPERDELISLDFFLAQVVFLPVEEKKCPDDKELSLSAISSRRGIGDDHLELTLQMRYCRQPEAGLVAVAGCEKAHDRGASLPPIYITKLLFCQ